MIYKILFFICNMMFLLQHYYITNKILSFIIPIVSVAGIIYSLQQSSMKTRYKFIISAIYFFALIIYFIFTYL